MSGGERAVTNENVSLSSCLWNPSSVVTVVHFLYKMVTLDLCSKCLHDLCSKLQCFGYVESGGSWIVLCSRLYNEPGGRKGSIFSSAYCHFYTCSVNCISDTQPHLYIYSVNMSIERRAVSLLN